MTNNKKRRNRKKNNNNNDNTMTKQEQLEYLFNNTDEFISTFDMPKDAVMITEEQQKERLMKNIKKYFKKDEKGI